MLLHKTAGNGVSRQTAMAQEQYDSNSFVLRIWREKAQNSLARQAWRGWVQHAASGERRYFCRLADLVAFIESYAGSLATIAGDAGQNADASARAD
jgi:hypothetical protein